MASGRFRIVRSESCNPLLRESHVRGYFDYVTPSNRTWSVLLILPQPFQRGLQIRVEGAAVGEQQVCLVLQQPRGGRRTRRRQSKGADGA
jgi:hypothetical protein